MTTPATPSAPAEAGSRSTPIPSPSSETLLSMAMAVAEAPPLANPELDDPSLYINRELSWLRFNERVIEEAEDESHPLLERTKFLAISANNLDEFFMVRVSGLRGQVEAKITEPSPDGMTTTEQLEAIRKEVLVMVARQYELWQKDLLPKLRATGIDICFVRELKVEDRDRLRLRFENEIFPVLTPLAFDPGHPFPQISNLSLNLAVVVSDTLHGERFARIKVPDILPRLVEVPTTDDKVNPPHSKYVWLEDVVAANLDMLFPGLDVVAAYPFRVTRDADLEIEEDDAEDLLTTIEESVEQRHFGPEVRIELDQAMPDRIRDILMRNLSLEAYQIYVINGPVGLANLLSLMSIERPDLKDPPYIPSLPPSLTSGQNIFEMITAQDLLLYHPYNSFAPVVDFVREAARDPDVLAIKLTLYRVGPKSPIVDALMEARENGKQVAVLVELKARFDEENNIAWARALEDAGVHVIYGLVGLKTHAKMCLVVRREAGRMRRYMHMSSGNYNTVTSRVYTDLGLFTTDEGIAGEMTDLFNALTGYSRKDEYRKLMVAPGRMRKLILERIEREVARQKSHGDGYLAFKANALVDRRCVRALYEASQAGVKIDLQIRGICCLRPGLRGVSENIRVTSIVGQFLEHARIFYFRNGGNDEVYLGSADLMPRNLERRIEILFPVTDPHLKDLVINVILKTHLRDNLKTRELQADGRYTRVAPKPGEAPLDSQQWMLEHWSTHE